ncbi:hypothetical protein NDU88_001819 [Pleurodeles waltl]|uniref:Uncharacterized protein n=1 Tax=Pleurodeles waltl TaxID=8319 RepID=A0AAV7V8V4_PLEWA|nr:hypothetical protein NDU88_001819 [Pleurodeles waltl]
MAESQQRLEKFMEKFITTASEARETFQKAITNMAENIKKTAQTQDPTIGRLANMLGQQQGHTPLPSVVLKKYMGEDVDFFSNFEELAQAAAGLTDRWGQ